MAENKAQGPEGVPEDPIGAETTPGADDAAGAGSLADDGYTPASDEPGEPGNESATSAETADDQPSEAMVTEDPDPDALPGEDLTNSDLPEPEPFEVMDDEAEELSEAPDDDQSILELFGDNDVDLLADGEGIVTDEDQLEAAEEDASEMESTKPVRKARPVKKTQPASETATDLVLGGAAAGAAAATSDVSGKDSSATAVKKNRPTRTRAEATKADAPKKTGPGEFISQVIQELKKVSWPTAPQLLRFFAVVLVFVLFMIAFIGVLDVFFGWLMLRLFG